MMASGRISSHMGWELRKITKEHTKALSLKEKNMVRANLLGTMVLSMMDSSTLDILLEKVY